MKKLGIIPARGGSKGIPFKNIQPLAGKPLIAYTIEAAMQAKLDKVVVTTDSERIAEISASFGAHVVMRPKSLAYDESPTLPVLQHAVSVLGEEYDWVFTLQPTSPLRTSHHIREAICFFEQDLDADSLVSIVRVPHNMSPTSVLRRKGREVVPLLAHEDKVFRRQDKSEFFARNGAAIYITPMEKLGDFIFGGKVLGFEMDWMSSIDIDGPEDLRLAEILMSYW